ncbi:hypothetical protein Tco_1246740 [Tanacetum coccineum]
MRDKRPGRVGKEKAVEESHEIALIGKGRYGCQDKKGMEKQHGANIMAVEVQIGDAMLHVTCVVNNQKGLKEDFRRDRSEGRVSRKGLECEREPWK